MRIPAPLVALGAAAVVLAGCSGGGSPVASSLGSSTQSVVHHPIDYQLPHGSKVLTPTEFANLLGGKPYVAPNTGCGTGALLYVSQYYTNTVQIYKQSGTNQSPCLTLSTSVVNPQGMTTNPVNGDVWVANTGANNVLVFKRGKSTSYKTLSDTGQYPVDVALDSNGNVYASNIIDTNGGPGSVSKWIAGKGSPKIMPIPNNSRVLFLALDNLHNLYVNYLDSSTGTGKTVEFVGGKGTAKLLKITTSFPGGLEFDVAQDLIGNDQLGPTVNIYELPNPKPQKSFTATGDPLTIAITKLGGKIYVSDASGGSVYEYSYPGFVLKDTISSGLGSSSPPFGLATDPGPKL